MYHKLSYWTENVLKMYINVQKTADFVLKMAENVLKMYINVHKWQFIGDEWYFRRLGGQIVRLLLN